MIWTRIIGVVLVLLAAWQIYRGRFSSADDVGGSIRVDRAKTPGRFWLTVAAEVVIGALMIFGVFDSLIPS